MKVEASVDIGNNLNSLLERLAQQLGTTADKVFPWYVQQAHIEGVTTIVAACVCLAIAFIALVVTIGWWARSKDPEGFGVVFFVGLAFLVTLLIGSIESVDAVRKIYNPNYYAMTMLTRDIGKLTGR